MHYFSYLNQSGWRFSLCLFTEGTDISPHACTCSKGFILQITTQRSTFRMKREAWSDPDIVLYPLCKNEMETASQLFWSCYYSKQIWQFFSSSLEEQNWLPNQVGPYHSKLSADTNILAKTKTQLVSLEFSAAASYGSSGLIATFVCSTLI